MAYCSVLGPQRPWPAKDRLKAAIAWSPRSRRAFSRLMCVQITSLPRPCVGRQSPTLSAERVRPQLAAAIQNGVAPNISDEGLRQSPLAIWVETALGVTRESETEPKLVRATPCTLKVASERLAMMLASMNPRPKPDYRTFSR